MVTAAAVKRISELTPALMAEFGLRTFARKRLAPNERPRENVLYVDYVKAWLLARGVLATLEIQGNALVPVIAVLIE